MASLMNPMQFKLKTSANLLSPEPGDYDDKYNGDQR